MIARRFIVSAAVVAAAAAVLAGPAAGEPGYSDSVSSAAAATPAEAYKMITNSAFDLEKHEAHSPEEVELGRLLFFDPRLSKSGKISCVTCHQPDKAWTDGRRRARGADGRELVRNTPSLFNGRRNIKRKFFWDGRAEHLVDAIQEAMQSRLEMSLEPAQLKNIVRGLPEYARRFERVYGPDGVTPANAAKAIAAFVETDIRLGETPFDRYRTDPAALDPAQLRGMVLFAGKARCVQCHLGPFLSDDYYHNTGLKRDDRIDDPGRYAVEPKPIFWRAFKTPPLSDVTLTSPYMHDGRFRTLEEVLDHYDRGGEVSEDRDPKILPLHLSPAEKKDIVAFLAALSAPLDKVPAPELPRPGASGAGGSPRRESD